MRRINLTFGTLLSLLFCSLLVVHFYQPAESSIVSGINDQAHQLLESQLADLASFENQLSVYTNPFAIAEEGIFEKRVFLNGGLIYWNGTEHHSEYSQLKRSGTLYPMQDDSGLKIVRRNEIVTNEDLIEVFSMIRVFFIPRVNNQYLINTYNEAIFGKHKVSISAEGKHQVAYEGIELFRFDLGQQDQQRAEWMECCLLLAIIGSGVYWVLLSGLSRSRFWSIAVLVFGRLSLFGWSFLTVSSLKVFNPIYFTSNLLNYSLGDLLLNVLLILLVLLQIYLHFVKDISKKGSQFVAGIDWVAVLLSVGSLVVFTYLFYECVWLILENSQVNLDISESIQFDELRVVAYLVVLLMALSFLIVITCAMQVLSMISMKQSWFLMVLILGGLSGTLVFGQSLWMPMIAAVGVTLAIQFLDLVKTINTLRYQSFIYLVIVFSFLASIYSFSVYKHFERDVLIAKERFASRLLIKNDIIGEYNLSQILEEIGNDRYVRTRLLSRLLSRQNIREKIKRQFLSSYFKKYDIDVYLFDADGVPLQDDERGYQTWRAKYAHDSLAIEFENIYFIEDKAENVRNKYVCFLDIEAYGREIGHIVLDLTLKKFIPQSVFPELLLESKYYMGGSQSFDYGVFRNGELLYKQGQVTFENNLYGTDFKNPALYNSGMEHDGYHYFGVKANDGRILIVVSPTYGLQAVLSNFSFVFLLMLFLVALSFLAMRLTSRKTQFNLSTKIQLFLGLSFLLPMFIVSIALINTLNRSYKEEIDRSFRKRSFNMVENLIDQSEAYFSSEINIDEYSNEVAKAAAISQSDLNVYSVSGKLVSTSQPEIFKLNLLSDLLNPEALYKINQKREQNIIATEHIGQLEFKTSYTALRSYEDGRVLGILAMPYFDSKNHLHRQQVEVFNNLVVIFSFIFLVSLVGGNFIIGQMVRPLKQIGDRISKTSLQETNQPIQYEARDEIGSLVQEYNKMLLKLEESKEALAISQKESAWKEIARQVAHEIKNPLTPMRLKIQQLMRIVASDSKAYKTYTSLIVQVDSLSSIADSFSEFAKMPAPNPETIDLLHMVEHTLDLYHGEEATIFRDFQLQEARIYIDPKIFGRILTNIVLNALQAVEDREPHIHMEVRSLGGKVLLSIRDNGKGIPEEEREKIFTPYFSTKTTGSGIGLAVAKKGIENAGGNIWFESVEGEGTTFFITLPLLDTAGG